MRLRKRIGDVWPIMPGSERPPENWPGWPDGKRFALVLTHDVESKAGVHKCRSLMQLELDLGFRSSFNFVPEGDYRVPAELREELTASGFEVGVHDLKHDGRLYRSRREFTQRAARINYYLAEWGAVGFRSAFMLRKLDWLHELGIKYDASTFDTDPFEPQPEGCQTIFPFWVPHRSGSSINHQLFFKRLHRASVHLAAGFHALLVAMREDDRHLAPKTRLDRRARWNGPNRHTPRLHGRGWFKSKDRGVPHRTLQGAFGLYPFKVFRRVLACSP